MVWIRIVAIALVIWLGPGLVAAQEEATVLVELFTSQGCSSCPPADRLLAKLSERGEVDGVEIIPLAFHVDYWNYIGWEDPFSSEAWSDRQRAYATAMELGTIYTPQIFLNGREQLVGADEKEVRRAIRRVAKLGSAVDLELSVDSETVLDGDLRVRAAASLQSEDAPRMLAMLAVYQNGLVTPVSRGENSSRTLRNERVVRGLYPLFEIGSSRGQTGEKVVDLALDPDWPRDRLGLALFLQDPKTLEIAAARAHALID